MGAAKPSRPGKRWRRWLLALLLAVLVWLAAVAAAIWTYADKRDPGPADAAVVLGAAVTQQQPSPVYAARIDHAIDLYKAGTVPVLVFTGGTGAGDAISEAQAGVNYALARGVPASAMRSETSSQTTLQNLQQAQPLLNALGAKRVLLVSDPLYMRRAVVLARQLGINAHPSPTPSSRYVSLGSRLGFLARETWFYAWQLLGVKA